MTDVFAKGKGMLSAAIAEALQAGLLRQPDLHHEETMKRAREDPKLFEGMNRAQRRAFISNRNRRKE